MSIIKMDNEKERPFKYNEFIRRFMLVENAADHDQSIIGCTAASESIKNKIDNLISSSKKHRQHHSLVVGPPDSGKTFIINHIAKTYSRRINFMYLKSSWITERQFGNPELRLRQIFNVAIESGAKKPTVVFLDDIHKICDKRKNDKDSNRIFDLLEDIFKSLNYSRVLIFAATDKPQTLGELTRCFRDEIRFSYPNLTDRRQKLHVAIQEWTGSVIPHETVDRVAEATRHFSFKDLESLCYNLRNRMVGNQAIHWDDFKVVLRNFKPTHVSSVISPCPPVKWQDIGGVDGIKMKLQKLVIFPIKYEEKHKKLHLDKSKGVLLYGPPGCSKTMLAQAIATESGFNFISIKGPELMRKYVGDSEAAIRELYRNARDIAPCIIFFDEIDSLASDRSDQGDGSVVGDRVTSQLLTELNGVEPTDGVFTLAATNQPNKLDVALLRPDRIYPAIYVPLPSREDRFKIFEVQMKKMEPSSWAENIEDVAQDLADLTNGYSGADIKQICQVAGRLALWEDIDSEDPKIERRHIEMALNEVKPSVRSEQLKSFMKFHEKTLELGQRQDETLECPSSSSFFSSEFHDKLKLGGRNDALENV